VEARADLFRVILEVVADIRQAGRNGEFVAVQPRA
jgi:hypothetical protein